jgi:hypothetical protein
MGQTNDLCCWVGDVRTSENSVKRYFNFGKLSFHATSVNKPPLKPLIRCFIGDSSPCVPLLGVSSTPLENASLQEASYLKERRVNIVLRLLAQGLVVVLVMAFGWWGMTTLGSDSLQPMRDPIYVPRCPLADTRLEKGSAVGGLYSGGRIPPDDLTPAGRWAKRACSWSRKAQGG